jgi:hypothetical protein
MGTPAIRNPHEFRSQPTPIADDESVAVVAEEKMVEPN